MEQILTLTEMRKLQFLYIERRVNELDRALHCKKLIVLIVIIATEIPSVNCTDKLSVHFSSLNQLHK